MIDFFFFLFCFLSFFNIEVKGIDNFFYDYMSIENTNSIKGIFVWLIIFCHKIQYGINKDYIFKIIVNNLGQKVVSMFFFYSGFGIYESLKKKGSNYIKNLPVKASILFVKFQIILLMFLSTKIFIFSHKVSFENYLLSFIFKNSLGNSNWFAFTIIVFYFYSYLSFRFIKKEYFLGILIITILCLSHSLIVYKFFYPRSLCSIDTIFCFVLGFYFSFIKIYLDTIIMKNDICYFAITTIFIFLYYKSGLKFNVLYISIRNALFSLLVIIISIKVKVNNEFLIFLNSHSFSIYLLQRLVLSIIYRQKIFINSAFIQLSFEFSAIFFIASLFDKYTSFIDKFCKTKLTKFHNNNISFHKIYINYQLIDNNISNQLF